jgi:hypothetical protein
LHPHVWYAASGDVFRRNIVWREYQPALMHAPPWGQDLDYNLMHRVGATLAPATSLQKQSGRDEHSIVADARFIDPAAGDYRVKNDSPALALGFVNFPMDRFGVQKQELKALARTPALPGQKPVAPSAARDTAPRSWLGATVRNVADTGRCPPWACPAPLACWCLRSPPARCWRNAACGKGDVILSVDGTKTADVATLLQEAPALAHFQSLTRHPAPAESKRAQRHAMTRPASRVDAGCSSC